MQTRYRFKVHGNLRPVKSFPLNCAPYFIDFKIELGRIVAIDIFEETDLSKLPRIRDGGNGTKDIFVAEMNLDKLEIYLIKIQNYLSVFGLREIEIDTYEVKWIPLNEEEKNLLHMYKFSVDYKKYEEYTDVTPFDLIARPILAAFSEPEEYDVSMAFYRRGCNDMDKRLYIEAFYDFYFVLETMFGDGQWKKNSTISRFKDSKSIEDGILHSQSSTKKTLQYLTGKYKNGFDYTGSDVGSIIEHIVETRGLLHHHNNKHPRVWSPDNQKQFHIDAVFIMSITNKIIFEKIMDKIYSPDIQRVYEHQERLNYA